MQLKQLLADEDAVSPVIGVILMVAITVILAAVIGTFVLGLGDNVQDDSPRSNFQFSYPSADYTDAADGDEVEITHNGGDNIDRSNVELQIGDDTFDSSQIDGSVSAVTDGWQATIATGDKLVVQEDGTTFAQDDDVRIVWESPSGGSSSTIGSSTIP